MKQSKSKYSCGKSGLVNFREIKFIYTLRIYVFELQQRVVNVGCNRYQVCGISTVRL